VYFEITKLFDLFVPVLDFFYQNWLLILSTKLLYLPTQRFDRITCSGRLLCRLLGL